jgi:DNA (cytosine-5)-methyltransferase 1
MRPTPTTRDHKGGRKLETLKEAGRNQTNSLPDAVNYKNGQTGQLNPQWVEWLMGFPEGWTDLKPSEMP